MPLDPILVHAHTRRPGNRTVAARGLLEAAAKRGLWNDSDIETDGSYAEGEAYYRDLAAFLRAVHVCVTHLTPAAFEVRTIGRWLLKSSALPQSS